MILSRAECVYFYNILNKNTLQEIVTEQAVVKIDKPAHATPKVPILQPFT